MGGVMAERILRVKFNPGVPLDKRFAVVTDYLKKEIEDGLRDEYVRRKAVEIVNRAGVAGHDELGEIRAICKWVQSNAVYRKDPIDVEYFHSARRLIKDIEAGRSAADCDDFVILGASLLGSIGYQTGALIVDSNADGTFNHVMLVVRTHAPTREFGTNWIPCELIFPTFKLGESVKVTKVIPLIADPNTKRIPVMMQNVNGLGGFTAKRAGASNFGGALAGFTQSGNGPYQLPIVRALKRMGRR